MEINYGSWEELYKSIKRDRGGAILQKIKKDALLNVPIANYYLAYCYYYGIGVEKNYLKAYENIVKAKQNGIICDFSTDIIFITLNNA